MSTLEPKADLAATPELALTGDGAGEHDLGAPADSASRCCTSRSTTRSS